MPDLLLELFSEEIPARMQRKAADDLRKLVTDALVEAGLVYEGAKAFATPRRLALTVHGLPPRSPDRREERNAGIEANAVFPEQRVVRKAAVAREVFYDLCQGAERSDPLHLGWHLAAVRFLSPRRSR